MPSTYRNLGEFAIQLKKKHSAPAVDQHQIAGGRLQNDWCFHAQGMPEQVRDGDRWTRTQTSRLDRCAKEFGVCPHRTSPFIIAENHRG